MSFDEILAIFLSKSFLFLVPLHRHLRVLLLIGLNGGVCYHCTWHKAQGSVFQLVGRGIGLSVVLKNVRI